MSHKIRQGPRLAFAEFKFPPANAELVGPCQQVTCRLYPVVEISDIVEHDMH